MGGKKKSSVCLFEVKCIKSFNLQLPFFIDHLYFVYEEIPFKHLPFVSLQKKKPTYCNTNSQIYFFLLRHPELAAVCRDSRTVILFPGPKSQNLEELVKPKEAGTVEHNIIIIDGTWRQAKKMFLHNKLLHLPKQVCVCICIYIYTHMLLFLYMCDPGRCYFLQNLSTLI